MWERCHKNHNTRLFQLDQIAKVSEKNTIFITKLVWFPVGLTNASFLSEITT